jgi:hypothetical protein
MQGRHGQHPGLMPGGTTIDRDVLVYGLFTLAIVVAGFLLLLEEWSGVERWAGRLWPLLCAVSFALPFALPYLAWQRTSRG